MIQPTIGRVVWVRNRTGAIDKTQPEVAIVTYVHGVNCINVVGWDHNCVPFVATSLMLKQDDPAIDKWMEGNAIAWYAEWMPYQKGQAAKTESLESRLAGGSDAKG